MSSIKELQSDLRCHLTEDGGMQLNDLEVLDLFRRLADIQEANELLQKDISRLRNTIGKPLISLIENFGPVVEYQRAEGE